MKLSCGLVLLFACCVVSAGGAAAAGHLESSGLKPEVLYIDLANPSDARGISIADEGQKAGLRFTVIDGVPAAEPEGTWLSLSIDPEAVSPDSPMLVVFSYYDSDLWNQPRMSGFKPFPDGPGDRPICKFWRGVRTSAGAFSDSWRWWSTLTYPDFGRRGGPGFSLHARSLRWVFALPLDEGSLSGVEGVRGRVLSVLADYGRLLAAENALQDARARMDRGLWHLNGEVPGRGAVERVREGAGRARLEMNSVIMDVLAAVDPAYLGLFDGNTEKHLAGLESFGARVRALKEEYGALAEEAESYMSSVSGAMLAEHGLAPMHFELTEPLGPDRVVGPEDMRDRFLFGLVRQVPSLRLPRDTVESMVRDQGIDSVYEYCLSVHAAPMEDGSFDFSYLDRYLGEPAGLRAELGMHNIPIPGPGPAAGIRGRPWFYGEGIPPGVVEAGRRYRFGGFRIRNADGEWDGYFLWNGNDNSFAPARGWALWSDTLINYSQNFFRAVGEHFRGDPRILRYVLNAEGGAAGALAAGYVYDAALPYFRGHLEDKFGDIDSVNRALGTSYAGFEDIRLPRPEPGDRMSRLTPEYYEYARLCVDRTKKVREDNARALREGDPHSVISDVQSSMYGGTTFDTYSIAVNTPLDTFGAGDSNIRSVRYQYSLNRYDPKPIWTYEPYVYSPWGAPEGSGYRIEEATRRMLTANLWTWFLWGHQGIPFYNQRMPDGEGGIRSDATDYRIADIMLGPSEGLWNAHPVLRLAAACTANLKRTYEGLLNVLREAPVVPARIGLLESATTHMVPWPARGTFSDVGHLQGRLEAAGRHFWFVPESGLVEGIEPMDDYRLIIAAYSTHLRPGAREALLDWVRGGGVLIGSGPSGLFDHYGRSEGGIPAEVFGMKDVEYGPEMITEDSRVASATGAMSGSEGVSLFANRDFFWKMPAEGHARGTRVLAALEDGTPVAVEREYGRGKVILTASAMGSHPDLYWPLVAAELESAQLVPEAASSETGVMLQVREDASGRRYLGVVNRNVSAAAEPVITVAGEFSRPRDLAVGGGWPIPSEKGGGVTSFSLRLEPGAGTLIKLGKSGIDLSSLSPGAEGTWMAMGRFRNLMNSAREWGLDVSGDERRLRAADRDFRGGRHARARSRLEEMTADLGGRWFKARSEEVFRQAAQENLHPAAAAQAMSYAAIAGQYFADGRIDIARERMSTAEARVGEIPGVYRADFVFPFVDGRLDLEDLSSWPEEGWQEVYTDRESRDEKRGEFILAGSPGGIYLGARVKKDEVVTEARRPGLPWRVMDGVVLHFRGLDEKEELPGEFRSDDTYEITFYSDGSVFVWDNLLPVQEGLIENRVRMTGDGYSLAGFIPAGAVRFWPRQGVTVITDVCLYYSADNGYRHTEGYWHGDYAQAGTWARVRFGDKAKAEKPGGAPGGFLPENTAQPCLRVEHWLPHEDRAGGAGRAAVYFDETSVLPNGKRGSIVLVNETGSDSVQLKTMFSEIGGRPGLRVWLKGESTGAGIELRATGREGYSWAKSIADDSGDWRAVDLVLDKAVRTREEVHFELLSGYDDFRPLLNRIIVRFDRPLEQLKIGLIEYL